MMWGREGGTMEVNVGNSVGFVGFVLVEVMMMVVVAQTVSV